MKIRINATIVAKELAIADTVTLFVKGTSNRLNENQIRSFLNGGSSLNDLIPSAHNRLDDDIMYRYQKQYDYYFEILTNHAL